MSVECLFPITPLPELAQGDDRLLKLMPLMHSSLTSVEVGTICPPGSRVVEKKHSTDIRARLTLSVNGGGGGGGGGGG